MMVSTNGMKRIMGMYAKRIGADFVAITKSAQDWWGLEKFRVHPFAQAYERTLYVDADVFLTEETPDLFEVVPAGHVAMHDDWSQLPSFEWVFEERRNILQSQELPMDNSKSVLNTGVVMCDRKHASIWNPLQQGVILADEVGLGKTIEAGLVLCQRWAEKRVGHEQCTAIP